MRCPKDAHHDYPNNKQYENWCLQESPDSRWVCTRNKGHRGLHHAHRNDEQCMSSW